MVTMLLTGTFVRSLDDKQRFSLPKSLRDALGATPGSKASDSKTPDSKTPDSKTPDSKFPETVLFLAPGTDGSLALYPADAFSQLAAQLAQDSPTSYDVRAFSRLFYAQAQRVEMDRQARIRIPAELARLADLERELVLVGVRDHLELWNRGRWEAYLLDKQTRYDEIAERVFQRPTNSTAEPACPPTVPQVPQQPR